MLAPIIEGIANVLMKAVGYINIFVKALTGVDLLAKASAKSMDKAAKSAKGLNKSLAGFDELNNLDTDAGSNIDTGISNPFASIQNVELPWAETIKAFGEWVKNNMPTVMGLLGGLTSGILIVKLGLSGILATKFGTSTLSVISGIIIAVTGLIKLVGDLITLFKEPTWINFGKVLQDIGLIILGVGMIVGGIPAIIVGALTLILGYVITHWNEIKQNTKLLWDFVKAGFWTLMYTIGGIFTTIALIIRAPFDTLGDIVKGVCSGIITTLKGVLQVFKGIFTGDMKTVLQGFKNIFKGVFDSLWSIAKAPLNLIIRGINALISGINTIKFDVPDWVPGIGGKRLGFKVPKIPLLSVGTNYVPEDQLAYIHKGEAVVPKKFNSEEYFGRGNEETNNLLEQVIDAINNIEVNPYTTIKDVGKTAVNYINSKSRQLGGSVIG